MKFALAASILLASTEASTIDFNDDWNPNHCTTHADCPKFFNESMVCANIQENFKGMNREWVDTGKGGYVKTTPGPSFMTFDYSVCTIHAACGFPFEMRDRNGKWTGDVKCMPNAPTMPATSLVTEEHTATMFEMMKIQGQMHKQKIA